MKLSVDQEKCIGCGACAATCPPCFEMIDGKSSVKAEECDCQECSLTDVADSCPAEAITVSE